MKRLSKAQRKMILNIAFIIFTFLLVLYLVGQAGDLGEIAEAFRTVSLVWLLGALGCFAAHVLLEGLIVFLFFRYQQVDITLGSCSLVGLIGMFYSNITPAATGGQPMQVFSYKKRGVSPGVATSALAVKFFCWQCALLVLGAFLWIAFGPFVYQVLGNALWLVGVGFFLNSVMVALVILLAISRNVVRAIIIFFVNLAHKIRLVKDVAKSSSKWDAALNDFHASVEILTKHPWHFLSLFALSLVQVTALMSVIYFVYRGFGLSQTPYIKLLAIQFLLYITASFTPLPGASGAQEGGFYLFFRPFFPEGTIFAALLVWRFFSYYMFILVGFAAVAIDQTYLSRRRRKDKKQALDDEPDPAQSVPIAQKEAEH
ncbi:MAG: lysylphosphatidylglycerol synthase transmembrane domain-containing protein [Eubacteriales bacterium]|nr:lysylphosphatidylglycerol synthase transmembrane domain-containing protein [Eubacteriales bacterium]